MLTKHNIWAQFVPAIRNGVFLEWGVYFLLGFAKKLAHITYRFIPILRNVPILNQDKKGWFVNIFIIWDTNNISY